MAEVALNLPKFHVYFKSNKTVQEVKTEVLGPLANGYENFIQNILDNAGQTGLTATLVRSPGKVMKDGDRWTVYLKMIVAGESDFTEDQIINAWHNRKADIKAQIKSRLENFFGANNVRFRYKIGKEWQGEES